MDALEIAQRTRELIERDLLTHNLTYAVRHIEPGESTIAATLLLWSSLEIEEQVEPPTFESAFCSRQQNIYDALRWLEALPDRSERWQTWQEANSIVGELQPGELAAAKIAISATIEDMSKI